MKQTIFLLLFFFNGFVCHAHTLFSVPDTLKDNVAFWKKIYTSYDSHQVVFFDQEDPTIIYAVLDLPKVPGEISSPKYRPKVKAKFKEIEKCLKTIHKGSKPERESEEYKYIHQMLTTRNLLDIPDLDKRLRHQSGLKSQFSLGLKLSGRYIDDMKAILKAQSLPPELVAMVFVESLFFPGAISHVGATGPWGIVKETGLRNGIFINDLVDERFDWQKSTIASASFIKSSMEGLGGDWGVVITSYNYGYAGMKRATEALGSKDIAIIIEKHESPIFKFASKNYYAEFLAALDVYENEEFYFPGVVKDKPPAYELVQLQKPVLAIDLFKSQAITLEDLALLNPSLTKKTLQGKEALPREFSLRSPEGKAEHFYERIKKIDPKKRLAAEFMICKKYRANGRESIAKIASKNGISASFLAEKLNKPTSYKPKGTVLVRSHAHPFSQLKEIYKVVLEGRGPTEIAVETLKP